MPVFDLGGMIGGMLSNPTSMLEPYLGEWADPLGLGGLNPMGMMGGGGQEKPSPQAPPPSDPSIDFGFPGPLVPEVSKQAAGRQIDTSTTPLINPDAKQRESLFTNDVIAKIARMMTEQQKAGQFMEPMVYRES